MMLVHKATASHPFPSPYHARRTPIHVQPTHTPGLLSLSKPKPSTKQREASSKTPLLKTPKTPSYSSDPFTANSSPRRKSPAPTKPATTLTAQPSGKLARRRQSPAQASPTPSPAKPAVNAANASPKSRRSPPPKQGRPVPQRALTIDSASVVHDRFPVCDDLTDAETNEPVPTAPSTPVRFFAREAGSGGPRTAPLHRTMPGYPFDQKSSPSKTPSPVFGARPALLSFTSVPTVASTPTGRPRGHGRSPSYQIPSSSGIVEDEGIFHMSSDEETGTSGANTFQLGNFARRPQLSGRKGHRSSASTSGHRSTASTSLPTSSVMHAAALDSAERARAKKAAYFAGSVFQDSPSPEELPAPSF